MISVPDGPDLAGRVESVDRPDPEGLTVAGPLDDGGEFVLTRADGLLDGYVRTSSREAWRITPDGAERTQVRPLPVIRRDVNHPPILAPEPPPETPVRLLVTHTIGALLDAGADRAAFHALVRDEVGEAAKVFRESGTGVALELVGIAAIAGRASRSGREILMALPDEDSDRFASVRRARVAANADVVSLISNRFTRERGKAFVRENAAAEFAPYAMNVIRVDTLGSVTRTLAHEIAHNFGADHDIEHVESDDRSGFGHAWHLEAAGRRFHTLLGKQGGELIPRFSNPRQTMGGIPLGCPRIADNARVIRRNSARLPGS